MHLLLPIYSEPEVMVVLTESRNPHSKLPITSCMNSYKVRVMTSLLIHAVYASPVMAPVMSMRIAVMTWQ